MYVVNNYYLHNDIYSEITTMQEIGKRSRGNPRLALKYAKRAMDYAHANRRKIVHMQDALKTFAEFGIDEMGLDRDQRLYLKILLENDGPVGIESLSMRLGEKNVSEVKQLIEPYLWSKGLITSSSRGRELTEKGHRHLLSTSGLMGEL